MHLHGSYDTTLLILSFLVSMLGSFTALRLAISIPTATGNAVWQWLAASAFALGGGAIWSMHFVAMLAYKMNMPVSYDGFTTVASLLVAVGVTGTGLYVVGRGDASPSRLIGAGAFTGLGVCAMHYLGMAGMRMQATLQYDLGLVAVSLLIAVVASTVALWLAFNMRGTWQALGSSIVMAIAVSGMHYTGMAAVDMVGTSAPLASAGWVIQPEGLGLTLSCGVIGLMVALLVMSQIRARQLASI